MSSFINLSRLIGQEIDEHKNLDHIRYAVVKNGVVSVTNGESVIIRRPTPGIPDGKYHFGFGDQLIPVNEFEKFRLKCCYPDIELLLPNQSDLFDKSKFAIIGSLDRDFLSRLASHVHVVKMHNEQSGKSWGRSKISFTKEGICSKEEIQVPDPDEPGETMVENVYRVVLPIKLDMKHYIAKFNANTLAIASVELQQYESVSILRRISDDNYEPFFIGAGLDRCAIIVPDSLEVFDGQYI